MKELLKAYVVTLIHGIPTEGKDFDDILEDVNRYAIEFATRIAPKAFELYLKEKW